MGTTCYQCQLCRRETTEIQRGNRTDEVQAALSDITRAVDKLIDGAERWNVHVEYCRLAEGRVAVDRITVEVGENMSCS